jgi:hypothetical protein
VACWLRGLTLRAAGVGAPSPIRACWRGRSAFDGGLYRVGGKLMAASVLRGERARLFMPDGILGASPDGPAPSILGSLVRITPSAWSSPELSLAPEFRGGDS